jgi:short-subunit dehydrogenase
MDIQNKVVIITGASAGIGLTTARLFAANGAKVALAARSMDKLSALESELDGSYAVQVDMTDVSSIKGMVEKVREHYGRIDVLINNAGQGMFLPLEQVDLQQARDLIELNVIGPLAAMQAVIPIMREQGGGLIINISSGLSKMSVPNLGVYASTKTALNMISLTARAELANDNIRLSIVYPGRTATEFAKNAVTDPSLPYGSAPAGGTPRAMPDPDRVEDVAEKILEAVRSEAPEEFMESLSGYPGFSR